MAMAAAATIARSSISPSLSTIKRLFSLRIHNPAQSQLTLSASTSPAPLSFPKLSFPSISFSTYCFLNARLFSTSEVPSDSIPTVDAPPSRKRSTLVNFSLSDSSDSESESEEAQRSSKREIDKSKLPPPYDPFNKKPAIEESDDPKNLQEVFHKIREDGMMNSAAKMFEGLSKDGLTHEALELFSQIKDKGQMPDVVAHTAVIEAYANAGQAKDAHKTFLRMLASGVLPNAYTYSVVIRSIALSGDLKLVKEAKKYVAEMVEKRGIKPNAATCFAAFEGLMQVGMEEEGKGLLEFVKNKNAVPEENKVREVLKDKRGPIYRSFMNILFDK